MILCVGTTGSGKTLMLRALAENATPGTAVSNLQTTRCRYDVSPSNVSSNENSWILRSLYYLSIGLNIPDRWVLTLDCMKKLGVTRQFGLFKKHL